MNALNYMLLIFIAFQIKHFLADYPLQGRYMLGKFKEDWSFFWPLFNHCTVHSYLTFFLALAVTRDIGFSSLMALLDFACHFIMDRIKAGPKYLGRFNDMQDKKFWWSLGLDQMVHHLTHYVIIYFIFQYMIRSV